MQQEWTQSGAVVPRGEVIMSNAPSFKKWLLSAFVALEFGLLIWWLLRLDGQYDNEDFLFFQILLVAIGFPSAIVALVLLSLIDLVVPIFAEHSRLAAVAVWAVLALAAYLQWFVWAPMLWERIRNWRHRRREA
jgi:hypothetical protein